MVRWSMAPQQQNRRMGNSFEGGVNTGAPNFYIKDSESSDEYGLDTFDYPALSVGKGWTAYGTSGGASTYLLANYKNTQLIRAVGTVMQQYTAGAWANIGTGLTAADWDSTNFNNKIIMTNGTDNVKSWDGTTFADLNAADAPKGLYITNNTVRVYIANKTGAVDTVYFSKYLDETNWTDVDSAGFFQYYTPDGGGITAIRLYQNLIMVFKLNSFAEVVSTGNSSNKHRLTEVSSEVGCVSYKTVVEVRGMLMWLGLTDVWVFTGGQPTPIGQSIRGYLDSINTAYYAKCWAATDGQRYYLGLVTEANTEPDTLLVYDTKYRVWRVRSKSIGGKQWAATLGVNWYTGDSSGNSFQMNTGTTENGSAVSWAYTSKLFDEGIQEAEKEYWEMHLQTYLPTSSTMTLAISTDDRSTSFTTIDTLTNSTSAQNTNHIVPLDTVPITNWLRYKLSGTGPATIYSAERYFRVQSVQY